MADTPNTLEQPGGAPAKPLDEPVIHVIPDKFYGAALKKRVAKEVPAKIEPSKAVPTPPPKPSGPPLATAGQPTPPKPPSGSKGWLVIVIVLVLLALSAAGGAYFLFMAKPAPEPEPPPVVEPPVATGPVCGDNTCESPETAVTCAADCVTVPPATVCGNGQCETGETTEACEADCAPKPPLPTFSADGDSDGVTDLEETEIFGTDPRNIDSDSDGFVDLNEIFSLFDPARPKPSVLTDNPGIDTYRSQDPAYSVLIPKAWTQKPGDTGKSGVIFESPSGDAVQVLVDTRPEDQTLLGWYLAQVPGTESADVLVFKTRQGYDEVLSPDRLTSYIAANGRVFVIQYIPGASGLVNYRATFQMMINSLTAGK